MFRLGTVNWMSRMSIAPRSVNSLWPIAVIANGRSVRRSSRLDAVTRISPAPVAVSSTVGSDWASAGADSPASRKARTEIGARLVSVMRSPDVSAYWLGRTLMDSFSSVK
jgi:hypothetical protein